MGAIEIVETGIVFRNPQPHLRSRHAYFPTLAELPSGELFAAFDVGSAFEAVDVRSYCSRSSDGGRTWSDPAAIFLPDESARPASTTCRVGQVNPGELMAWGCLFDRSFVDQGLSNPRTNGFCRTDFATLRSVDGGRTWSGPRPVTLPVSWSSFETCAPPFPCGDGRLLVPTTAWPDWNGNASPWQKDGLAFASSDGGETWSELVRVFRNTEASIAAFEQALTRLSDGRLLAVCWTHDVSHARSLQNRIAISSDGHSFGAVRETPLNGETCRLLALADNHVLAVYRRVDIPGLWAQVAHIDGEQWIPQTNELLWTGGATYGVDVDGAMARMSSLRFGCPAIVRLKNGDAFVVFWCVEDCVSVIRWIRLKINL